MDISYENMMNLAFDKPLEYKTLSLYPAKLFYYSIFSTADECLDVSRLEERDLRLIKLPYLEYMYEKSLVDEDFKYKWNMLIYILNIVLQEQPFDIIREDGRLYLKVYQRSKDYELLDKRCKELQFKITNGYDKGLLNKEQITKYTEELVRTKESMTSIVKIGSEDFEEIRQLIMLQNDIKPQHFDTETEKMLFDKKEKLRRIKNSKSENTIEDLIDIVAYTLHIPISDMEKLTIRRFNRYLNYALSKDDFYMYKTLELSGAIEMKSEIPHWTKHYEPKGKFDDVLVDSGSLLESLDGQKI